jgi:hypothetical protein
MNKDILHSLVHTFQHPLQKTSSFLIHSPDRCFFGRVKQSGESPLKVKRPLMEETYKEMWMLRYQQHLGQITFLELLDKYEKMPGIPPLSKSDE